VSLVPVTPRRPLIWPACIDALRAAVAPAQDVYLVGGAVRDAVLGRPLHDIDLAVPGDGRPVARRIANGLHGDYYSLDPERGVGRALIPWESSRLTVDVARFRGPDLLIDLQRRDFTLNAMAAHLVGDLQAVIDPLGGLADLEAKRLRQCSPESIPSDPVRALRAVRTSVAYGLLIEPDTLRALRENVSRLPQASVERVRDEFFQILGGNHPAAALSALDHLALLEQVVPEAASMRYVEQGPPHQFDVWRHTLFTIERLDRILQIATGRRGDDLAANVQFGLIVSALAGVRGQIRGHLSQGWPNERSHSALLVLAALLHDTGKPLTRSTDEQGRTRFVEHERASERLAQHRAVALRLSRDETLRLAAIVRHHMRPHWLHSSAPLTPRAIYRFWRDTGPAGVDICLLAMADYLATYGTALDSQNWITYLDTIQSLLERYCLHFEQDIAPPPLVTGEDLVGHFQIEPGPQIGRLLDALREAQIEGQITTREEALARVARLLDDQEP
jgi:tRNA nucleotidyltransferase/poly(A) polymerase